jgi:hypothetical protein
LTRGRYQLRLVDLATGIEVLRSKVVDGSAGGEVEVDLEPRMALVRLDLVGAKGGAAECTELVVDLPDAPEPPVAPSPWADTGPRGTRIWVGNRPGRVDLFLPAGPVQIQASASLAWAFDSPPPDIPKILAEKDITVAPGVDQRLELRIAEVSSHVRGG